MIEDKIHALMRDLSGYADLVKTMIEKAIGGLLNKDRDLLAEVMEREEPRANELELEIEERCTTLIAQFEPKAKDLRTLLMAVKMNHDLERMGDHAVNIAESALFLIERPPVKPLIDIPRIAEETIAMLKDSITAFVEEDAKLAKKVCERDEIVDNLRDQILRELITYMTSDPATIERSMHLIRISQNLERIADLSTNICEDVIYMVEGRIIQHHKDEEQEGG